ncbi:hypothetical protein TNCV_2874031 [Trichonephila clavipes]|nr:hypothetical protein TNCV_2874031 [Trichonephila clavipes]
MVLFRNDALRNIFRKFEDNDRFLVKEEANTTVLSSVSKRTVYPHIWGGVVLKLHLEFRLVGRVVFFSRPSVIGVMDCDLSYCNIAAGVSRDPMTVRRIRKQWVPDGNTERRAGSQRIPLISSREVSHVIRKALMDREATS